MRKIDIIEIWTCQSGNCFYCHRPMSWAPGSYTTSYTKDHFHAKSRGNGLNRNTVLAHEKCNYDKEDREPNKQEKAQFKKLYKAIDERLKKLKTMKESNRGRKKDNNLGRW